MNKTVFKVIGTWGAQKYTTQLGEFESLEEAQDRVDNWQDAPEAYGLHMDLIEVIKVTETTVSSTRPLTLHIHRDANDPEWKVTSNLNDDLQVPEVGLRREMEALRDGPKRHEEWERQQERNKEVSDREKTRGKLA